MGNINVDQKDTWYWKHDKLGNYSVKSAYACIQDGKYHNINASNSGFWRQLWNLKIPPKVKHFMWRAVTGSLPTKDNLRCKRVDVDKWCPVCQNSDESILHVLVLCSFAKACWNLLGVPVISGQYHTFLEWVQFLFDQHKNNEAQQIVMTCWMIWKSRNDLVWNQRSLEAREVVESVIYVLNQWRYVQDKSFDAFMGYMTQDDGYEHWQLPKDNRVKVNCHAVIFENSNSYSYAFVIKNHLGQFIEARSKCLQGQAAPELAEAVGVREALSWIKENQYSEVDVESNCLQVVQAIRSSISCLSYFGRVIEECRLLLVNLKDRNVLLRFVKQSANGVSHFINRIPKIYPSE